MVCAVDGGRANGDAFAAGCEKQSDADAGWLSDGDADALLLCPESSPLRFALSATNNHTFPPETLPLALRP